MNRCLQYSLNTFYHDICDIKKTIILLSVVNWGKCGVDRSKNNAFVFNRILWCNIVLFDGADKE